MSSNHPGVHLVTVLQYTIQTNTFSGNFIKYMQKYRKKEEKSRWTYSKKLISCLILLCDVIKTCMWGSFFFFLESPFYLDWTIQNQTANKGCLTGKIHLKWIWLILQKTSGKEI